MHPGGVMFQWLVFVLLASNHWRCTEASHDDDLNIGDHKRNVELKHYIDEIVETHNRLRQLQWDWMDGASNIMRLSWSKDLATAAKTQSTKCDLSYREHKYGYNYALRSTEVKVSENMIQDILTDWSSKSYDIFRPCSDDCNSFTQMIWAETTEIGCALQLCSKVKSGQSWKTDEYYFVCLYYKKGNIDGVAPAKYGVKQCAGCDEQTQCDNGLCFYEESCKNVDPDERCDKYAEQGFCETVASVREMCKRSCRGCADDEEPPKIVRVKPLSPMILSFARDLTLISTLLLTMVQTFTTVMNTSARTVLQSISTLESNTAPTTSRRNHAH